MTTRAVCFGLFVAAVVNLVMAYNDFYLQNNLLIGNHFPMASIALLFAFVLAVNPALRRVRSAWAFSSAELLLVWGMIGVAGGIGSAGLMRYLPSWVAGPAYYATPANEFAARVLAWIPDWMLLGKDPDDPALKWFMEGLPRGGAIPWARWIGPLSVWSAFALFLAAVFFSLASILFRQWAESERLIFPIVHLPVELVRDPEPGRAFNGFLRTPAVWIGAGMAGFVMGMHYLKTFFPALPLVPLSWSTWGWFADRPWSEFNIGSANVYFSVVGLTFLLTTEMSFSLWFFHVLYRLSFVYVAALGAGATGFFGDWSTNVTGFEAGGAVLVLAGFIIWTARNALRRWLRRARRGDDDPDTEPIPPRLALLLLAGGFCGAVAWLLYSGVSWWASAAAVVVFVAVILVLTRLVAEAGLLFVQSNVLPQELLAGLVPAKWMSGTTLNVLVLHKAIHMHDLRETMMPYLMNGLEACRTAAVPVRKVMLVFALAAVTGLVVSAYGRVSTYYKYGGMNLDNWATVQSQQWWLGVAANHMKNPPSYEFVRLGETGIVPVRVAHLLAGAAASAALLVLRAKYLWWPLHPFGLVMVGVWAMQLIWFSLFLGWLAKACVMRFGGAQAYRRVLPFFLGLVLGEMLVTAVFTVVSLATGTPIPPPLPR